MNHTDKEKLEDIISSGNEIASMEETETKVILPFDYQILELFEDQGISLVDNLLPKILKVFDDYKEMIQLTLDNHIDRVEMMEVKPGSYTSSLKRGSLDTLIHLKKTFKNIN